MAYVDPTGPTLRGPERRRPITGVFLSPGATMAVTELCGLAISIAASPVN